MAAADRGPADALLISFKALDRAQHTIEDFVQTYFPLHGLDPLKDFLRWWHLLVFVEGVIYQADEDNEAAAGSTVRSGSSSSAAGVKAAAAAGSSGNGTGAVEEEKEPTAAGLAALEAVVRQRGLLAPGVLAELAAGQRYWREERRLCSLMQRHPVVPAGGHGAAAGFTLEEVLAASAAKSFDYRLLHHLLYALRKVEPNLQLLAFLEADELLVDIGDDLLDYEDDITAGDGGGGSFNIFRCYVHLYGTGAPLQLVKRIGELEARRDAALAALPFEQQAHMRRRTVDAAEEGEGALRWQMPPVVLDEDAFRLQFAGVGAS